jgi:GTP cyclohydrolase IA
MAEAYAELLTPRPFTATTFPNDEGYDELVVARDIPFHSLCEHHLLPFHGVAHVGYIPSGSITGISKLARLVDAYAKRPQVQERLTAQIADTLMDRIKPQGVIVVVEAEHLCMAVRGVRKPGAKTLTSAVRGVLERSASTRAEAMNLILGR